MRGLERMALDYIPVIIDRIPVGLELDCKVYIFKGGEYSYLCEHVKVTENLRERFRNAAYPRDSVYLTADYLEAFLKRGIDLGWRPDSVIDEIPEPETISLSPPPPPPPVVRTVPPPDPPEYLKVKRIYEETKEKTKAFLAEITEAKGKINIKKTDDFIHDVGEKLETNNVSMILQSINGIRNVDEYLHTHSLNVAFLNGLMARWLNFDKKRHDELIKVGLLHDIGKLLIPPEIINKPGKLTPDEFHKIKMHSTYSFEMLVNSGIREKEVLLGVVQHHEKLNGTGYPYGIRAEEIIEYARITSISDIYDAMIAKRVYKDAHSPFEILANFAEEGYSLLDISLVKRFIDCMIGELKGKYVVLSDGAVAKVIMVNERKLIYPIVEVDGKIIDTSPELCVVAIYNANHSAEEVEEIYNE
jgi:putative nucleotidyltransferase with HDIG domain